MKSEFEKKFGRYAIPNLSLYLIIGYVIGYLIYYINPDMYGYMMFDPYMILHGQIWRIFTWILIPPESFGIFTIIMLILYYQLGQGLERAWGTYRYNVYIFSGFLFTIASAIILYIVFGAIYSANIAQAISMMIGVQVSTYYVNMSIFLAYAATYPEEQLMLYFLIPIKIKWFGIIYGVYILGDIIRAFKYYPKMQAVTITILIAASLLNFILYMILGKHRGRFSPKQAKRRYEYKQSVRRAKPMHYEGGAGHKCAVCGRTEITNPELTFRYCSKCSGNKEYCQEHLFTHTHN